MVVQGSDESIRRLAEEAQRAWAKISPDMLMTFIRELDARIEEYARLQGVNDQLSMTSRDLLSAAKSPGGLGGKGRAEEDAKLFHNLETALSNSDALKRFKFKNPLG